MITTHGTSPRLRLHHVFAWLLGLLLITPAIFAPTSARAIDDPTIEYRTITTPHFEVHHPARLEALAWKTAQTCEEAHKILSPLLAWTPATRTHVVVTDQSDTANGFAGVYGRNQMTIFGMPPESDSVLGYYDDWLRILVYHEYTHILHIDTTLGISPYINLVIGKQLAPNQVLPRWYIEGLAVYHESARTGTGRIHSGLFQMWMRAEADSDEMMALGQMTGSPTRWPFGSVAYLYGSFFVDFVARRHGADALTRFNHIYGGRLIPYSLNDAMKEATGETFEQMWRLFHAEQKAKARAARVIHRARGATALQHITPQAGDHKFPRRRPGTNTISFRRWDYRKHPTYATVNVKTGKLQNLFEIDGAEGPSTWTRDGQKLIYSRSTVYQNTYAYQDLYLWNARTKTTHQLTRFDRAREPALSPDNRTLAFVRNRHGTMELVIRAFNGHALGKERILLSADARAWYDERRWQQLATPEWTPDGRGIVFSWWRMDRRRRDLWLYRIDAPEGARLKQLTHDDAVDRDPHFAPNGLLLFTSDRTGTYNIHAMDLRTRAVWQLSNVYHGVFSPQTSADGRWIYAIGYTHQGYQLVRFKAPVKPWPRAPITHAAPTRRAYPEVDWSTWRTTDYTPRRWLKPLFFTPDLAVLSSGAGFAMGLSGSDPLGRHIYEVAGGWTSAPGTGILPSVGGFYAFRGGRADLDLSVAYQQYILDQSLFEGSKYVPFKEQRVRASGSINYPISTLQDRLSLSVNYVLDWRGYAEKPAPTLEPGSLSPVYPEQGWFNSLGLSINYSYLEQFPYSVSVERGVSGSLSVDIQNPTLGSDYESMTIQGSVYGFHPIPWLERHVLKASVHAGMIETNFRSRSQFGVGGLAPQHVLSSLIFQLPGGGLPVRGFPRSLASGNQYVVANAEYRFPILELDQGFSTTPMYLRRLKGRVFVDSGTAYNGYLQDAPWYTGVGAELHLTAVFGYFLPGTLRLGYAHGFGAEGINDLYLLYGGGF